MTRKLTDVLKSDFDLYLPDNEEGLITPQIMRDALKDIIDSLRPAWAAIYADHAALPVTFATGSEWTKINTAGLFTVGGASDTAELNYDLTAGEIVVAFGSFNHVVQGLMNFAGATNVEYQFSVAVDNVPQGILSSIDGAGSGRVVAVQDFAAVFPPAGSKIAMVVRSPAGPSSISISTVQILAQLQTTRFL